MEIIRIQILSFKALNGPKCGLKMIRMSSERNIGQGGVQAKIASQGLGTFHILHNTDI